MVCTIERMYRQRGHGSSGRVGLKGGVGVPSVADIADSEARGESRPALHVSRQDRLAPWPDSRSLFLGSQSTDESAALRESKPP